MNINLTLLMQAVAFGVFIWFCAKFVWPPLMRAIEARQKQIADGLAAGEEGRQSLSRTEAKAEGERIIAAAKAEIEQEVSRAKEALRNQVADLAVAGASQILKREVDAKAHADLLAALQKQL